MTEKEKIREENRRELRMAEESILDCLSADIKVEILPLKKDYHGKHIKLVKSKESVIKYDEGIQT